jgi:subtilisin family serine protease
MKRLKRPALFPFAAISILALGAFIAGCGGGGSGPGPVPTNSPTNSPTPNGAPSGPQTTFTPRTSGTGQTLSVYSIQSNPSGLAITVVGQASCNGVTPKTCTPIFSNTPYPISIAPNNGNATFTYTTDQTANGNHLVYYNQNADTNGSIGSVSATSVTRTPLSVSREDFSGTPRFTPFRSAGLPAYSSSRVAVHYLVSALQMGGRHAQDVERVAGVQRAVDIGFARDGQMTRIVNVPIGQNVASVVASLKSHSEVVSAEALQLRYKTSVSPITPNDTHYATTQWDMLRTFADYAWAYSEGTPETVNIIQTSNAYSCTHVSGIAVAILDTGADVGHQDLAGGKITCAEKVVGGTITYGTAAVQDTDGHGTNVSGIAAANTNNGFGFAGIGFNVSLQEYKIFADSANLSADTGDEAQAIYDAVHNGARVINLSLGGGQSTGFDPVERDAVEFAIVNNVAVVAAAGNETATTLDFPAGYDGVISVGATSLDDSANPKTYLNPPGDPDVVASYSNSGSRLTLVAPGGDPPACETIPTPNCTAYTGIDVLHWIENIYTRTPLSSANACSTINDCRALFAGTSQATPHVSGAVALLLSKNPNLTVAQVTQILESTADDIGDPRQGHGRLNLYRAMAVVAGDNAQPGNGGLPLPANVNFVAFAYTNSGGTVPTIIDQTYTKGVPVASNGTFRIADILFSAGPYHCAVWADTNGDGKVDAGDWFGVATGTGTGSTPCTFVTGIVAHPVSAGFTLP